MGLFSQESKEKWRYDRIEYSSLHINRTGKSLTCVWLKIFETNVRCWCFTPTQAESIGDMCESIVQPNSQGSSIHLFHCCTRRLDRNICFLFYNDRGFPIDWSKNGKKVIFHTETSIPWNSGQRCLIWSTSNVKWNGTYEIWLRETIQIRSFIKQRKESILMPMKSQLVNVLN